jgi:two-component system, NarL family, nitrate/nitrite response regulator NarL
LHTPLPPVRRSSVRSRDWNWTSSGARGVERASQTHQESKSGLVVLIVDRDEMSSDLLATRLTREGSVQASSVRSEDLLEYMAGQRADLVVIGADLNDAANSGFGLSQVVCRVHPAVPIVILLNQSTNDAVINAFRSGARGVFSRKQPVADFLDCIEHARKGFIWAGAQETTFLLEAFASVPSPEISASPLTTRELEVVKCAARGKTNKAIAGELGLSEHTVKNYLFRAFEKLGVSNRVELLFYLTQKGHTFGTSKTGQEPEGQSDVNL